MKVYCVCHKFDVEGDYDFEVKSVHVIKDCAIKEMENLFNLKKNILEAKGYKLDLYTSKENDVKSITINDKDVIMWFICEREVNLDGGLIPLKKMD